MTTDSANKRASIGNMPWSSELPIPDSGISSSDRMMMGGEYLIHPWVSALNHNNSSGWTNPENSYDDNLGTFAQETVHSSQDVLELEWAAGVWTDMIRIYAHDVDIIAGTHDATGVKVDVWMNSAWTELLSGAYTIPEDTWWEYPIGQKIVGDKIRITHIDTEEYLYVAGFQFLNLASTMPDSIIPKTSGGLTSLPLLRSGLA